MASHRFLVAIVVGMVAFASAAGAEEPYDITSCFSWKLTQITASEELTITASESTGITQSHNENKAFDNNTVHCVVLGKKTPGGATLDGYCKYLEPNGDIAVGRFGREGGKGTWEFIHGTGKWKGITGGGTYEIVAHGKPVAPGTFQSCSHATGTFALPK
jgi:hypothetical protein